ncbi:MAG TPA: amino acid ABC transporter permease, partial [Candidatus Cloacimonadota bacterium]|nr:amino acid ABC transporter permease [Candidatus Cloacimonadota bacterium]
MLESLVYVLTNFPLLLKGVWIAVLITVCSMLLGMVLGIAVAFLRIYGKKPVRKAVSVYEWIFRGLPQLVMLFIVYFGLPELGLNLGPFLSVVLALGLCSSAYQAQIYRGAILSIGSEQMEAGLSLGMTKTQTLFHIILPQAVRLSLPGFTNEFTIVLKDSP